MKIITPKGSEGTSVFMITLRRGGSDLQVLNEQRSSRMLFLTRFLEKPHA